MNTVFLRLDGPLQSWGHTSRLVYRETADVPTFSGVVGLVCAAMGLRRHDATNHLKEFAALTMGVRVDRPGRKLTDYHTAGAKVGMWTAAGKVKVTQTTGELETHVMRKEYLADASFLVALHGAAATVEKIVTALRNPVWPPFLGRKSCPPSLPVCDKDDAAALGDFPNVGAALAARPWQPRFAGVDQAPAELRAVLPAKVGEGLAVADVPVSFAHRVYKSRNVCEVWMQVREGTPLFEDVPRPDRKPPTKLPGWEERRQVRLCLDRGLCVFCKEPARQVHHVTYAHAGHEPPDDLRSLCRVCHDAVTLLEYAGGMGTDRIDPCDRAWRERVLDQRVNILTHRDQLRRARPARTAEEDD